ncbi:MAG: spore coat protein CotJB [bacterium]
MDLAKAHVKDQPFEKIFDLEKGFLLGTIFPSLIDTYKFTPSMGENILDERKKVLYIIDVYSFAVNDLVLYLDTHPTDKNCLELCNQIRTELLKVYNYYNEHFPALTQFTPQDSYEYLNSWPWEAGM